MCCAGQCKSCSGPHLWNTRSTEQQQPATSVELLILLICVVYASFSQMNGNVLFEQHTHPLIIDKHVITIPTKRSLLHSLYSFYIFNITDTRIIVSTMIRRKRIIVKFYTNKPANRKCISKHINYGRDQILQRKGIQFCFYIYKT